jgi:hypothetical protein
LSLFIDVLFVMAFSWIALRRTLVAARHKLKMRPCDRSHQMRKI